MSDLEQTLAVHLHAIGLPEPVREYRFAPPRCWRFDLAWPDLMLAVEVEGGTWVGGRHTRPRGFERDAEKYNAAVMAGWRVLRVTSRMVRSGQAARMIQHALGHVAAERVALCGDHRDCEGGINREDCGPIGYTDDMEASDV